MSIAKNHNDTAIDIDKMRHRLTPHLFSLSSISEVEMHCDPSLRKAGVLIPILVHPETEKQPSKHVELLFVQRATGLPHHSGEIAFPGGTMKNEVDRTFLSTALRETYEETGIPPSQVHPWGYLAPVKSISRFCIVPVVAQITPPYNFQPDHHEIVNVFTVPLTHLMSPINHRLVDRLIDSRWYHLHSFLYRKKAIWGVTGALVYRILSLLDPALFPSDSDPYHAEIIKKGS
ncbi:MAG: NUDIX hydrolase [Candidatus Ranarchaeia archaeon]